MSNKSNDNSGKKSNNSHGGKTLSENYKPTRTGELVKSHYISNTLPAPGKPGGNSGGSAGSGGGDKEK